MWPDIKVMLVTLIPITSTRYITPTDTLIFTWWFLHRKTYNYTYTPLIDIAKLKWIYLLRSTFRNEEKLLRFINSWNEDNSCETGNLAIIKCCTKTDSGYRTSATYARCSYTIISFRITVSVNALRSVHFYILDIPEVAPNTNNST